jgi:hypothetical protein
MFLDSSNIYVHPVSSPKFILNNFEDHPRLELGTYRKEFSYDPSKFDQEYYRQAKVDFSVRWDKFHVIRNKTIEERAENVQFALIHTDPSRGIVIDERKIDSPIIFRIIKRANVFEYLWMIQYANQIHVINSSFLLLIDSVETVTPHLYLHTYATPDKPVPSLRKKWNIIDC